MAVTDLTNTKWLINSLPERPSTDYSFSINFSSNNNNYTQLQLKHSAVLWNDAGIIYDDLAVYGSFGGWHQGEAYRTIEITDGTDVTNRVFIAWLTANATQVVETTGKMYFGTSSISKMYIGQQEVSKVYLGQDLVYEKKASSNVTLTFNVNFTTLDKQGILRFKFDTPPSDPGNYDYMMNGGWGSRGVSTEQATSTAPYIPTEYFSANDLPTTFSISIPAGTTIYVWGKASATNCSINGVAITQSFTAPASYTITQDTTFNILLSGEND